MSNKRQPTPPPAARARRVASPGRSNRTTWLVSFVVVVIAAALVAALVLGRSGSDSNSTTADTPTVLRTLTSVPAPTRAKIGVGTVNRLPVKIAAPALTAGGKPQVFFMGAEYCPYCAAERWSVVEALSRFGTFTALKTTHSSSTDVFPSTQTLSFVGASYTSKYLSFDSVELKGNELQGNDYPPLQKLNPAQEQLVRTYSAPPFLPAESAGSIPFIDFGGRFLVSGASYDPGVLQGKSALEIAQTMSDPSSPVAQGATGAANVMTAVLCQLTGGQPGPVCSAKPIPQIQPLLK